MFDSTFHIPKGSTPSLRTGGSTNAGALFYKTADSSLQLYTGTQWLRMLKVGDTTGMLTPYFNSVGVGLKNTGQTVYADTLLLSTRLWRNKGIDSVQANLTAGLATKLNISDTSSMLSPYARTVNVRQIVSDSLGGLVRLKALNAAGAALYANSGTKVAEWGLGGSANIDFHGFAGYDINRAGSYTERSFTDKNYVDSAINASPSGTVTSVATNTGTGITGGTITTTGTLAIDTLLISTRAWRQKGIDSVAALLPAAISGTTNYIPKFTSSSAIGNSLIYDDGTNVGIGTTTINTNNLLEVYKSSNGPVISSVENPNTGTAAYAELQVRNMSVNNTSSVRMMAMGTAYTTAGGFVQNSGVFATDVDMTGGMSIITRASAPIRFYTNGHTNERMRLDASGNLGIGTSSPAYKLDVTSSGFNVANFNSTYGQMAISFSNNGTNIATLGSGVSVTASAGANDVGIGTSGLNNAIVFATGTGYTERMRITSGGNVGIGTTSPTSPLTVYALNNTAAIRVTNGPSANNAGITLESLGGNVVLNNGNGPLEVSTGGSLRMTLTTSGNLGLGVTPSAWSLGKAMQIGTTTSILNDGSGSTYLGNNFYYNSNFLYSTNSFALSYVQSANGEHRWLNAPSGTAGNAISFTQAMTLFSTGNLAVGGTSDGGERLQVTGTVMVKGVSYPSIAFDSDASSTTWSLYSASSNDYFGLYNGTTDVLVAKPSGQVGIGTTSPQSLLHVASSIRSQTIYGGTFNANDGTNAVLFGSYFNTIGSGNSYDGVIKVENTSGFLSFIMGASERMRITSGGNVLVGTTTDAGYKLDVNGSARFSGSLTLSNTNPLILSYAGNSDIWLSGGGPLRIINQAYSTALFTLANSGAATFSSSVTAVSGVLSSNGVSLRLGSATGNAGANLLIAGASTTKNWSLGVQQNVGGALEFTPTTSNGGTTIGTTPAMVLTDGGSLGIGTTSPGAKLEVNGAIKTAAPSGGTAKPYKWGEAGVAIGGSDGYAVKVEIDGTLYYLMTAYLPEPEPEPSAGPSMGYKAKFEEPVMKIKTESQEIKDLKKEIEELKKLIKNK